MADLARYPDSDSGYPGVPRWVKVFGMVLIALIVLIVVLLLTGVGGGRHGLGRHMPSGEAADQTAPSGTTEEPASPARGHTMPEGGH